MSSIVIKGNTSGQVEIAAPDVAGSTTLTLPTGTGNFITSDSNGDVTNVNGYLVFNVGSTRGIAQNRNGTVTKILWKDTTATDNLNLFNPNSSNLLFGTANTERMRINDDGRLLVNQTSTTGAGYIQVSNSGGSALNVERNTSSGPTVIFYFAGVDVGSIDITASSTSYTTSSDYRLKENNVNITDGISRVKLLKPYRFNFIVEPDKTVDGFFAHEVQDIVPEAISGTKDAVDEEGNPEYQGIDQAKLVPLLTAALQEAITKIEDLETRIEALENA